MGATRSLTNLEMELLQTFSFEVSEQQLLEIRQLLIDYFADQVTEDIDALFAQNDWGDAQIAAWKNKHMCIRCTS